MDVQNAATELLLEVAATEKDISATYDGADVSPKVLEKHISRRHGTSVQAGEGLNLQGRNLTGASLRSANLSGADLRDANMTEVRGSGMLLCGARLEGTHLSGIDLVGADLTGVDGGEANFVEALLEDARLCKAQLRFADLTHAILEGADLTEADLWGAKCGGIAADRVLLHRARLDESYLVDAQLPGADLSGATLRRANLSRTSLENANLRDAVLDNANLAGADLTGASLPNLSLATCDLTGVSFAGAWLDRTRMRARQLGGAVGEERSGNLAGAIDSYIVLERNFLTLGLSDDASWAYLRRRRAGRQLHQLRSKAHYSLKEWRPATMAAFLWLSDTLAEWLCDYGESLARVARAFATIWVGFALVYWLTGSLRARDGFVVGHLDRPVDYLLFSLNSMTTVGTSEVGLRPKGELGILLSSLQTVFGTVLLGLFGFVLGARIRN